MKMLRFTIYETQNDLTFLPIKAIYTVATLSIIELLCFKNNQIYDPVMTKVATFSNIIAK